jgi:hypothetical protein
MHAPDMNAACMHHKFPCIIISISCSVPCRASFAHITREQLCSSLIRSSLFLQAPKINQRAPTSSSKPAGFELGFTKENEVFVGRLAMTGFAASVVGEVRTRLVCCCWCLHCCCSRCYCVWRWQPQPACVARIGAHCCPQGLQHATLYIKPQDFES